MSDAPEVASIERFISAGSAAQRDAALSDLVKQKKHQAAWKVPAFQKSVTELARQLAETEEEGEERLVNLAVLARIYSAIKASRPVLVRECGSNIKEAPPPLAMLRDPDDRLALATLLVQLKSDWVANYAAKAIASEDSAERTRDQLIAVMLTRLELASVLKQLATQLEHLEIGTESPADAMGRRLRRIVMSLRRQLPIQDIEGGQDVGLALQAFLSRPFLSTGEPKDDKAVRELADEALGLVHDIVRTQLALAADSDVYNATSIPRSWIAKGLWPRFVQRSRNGAAILQDLRQAILLLGRQGVTSAALRDRLVELTGSSDAAGITLKALAAGHPELSPDVRRWLETGGRATARPGAHASRLTEGFGADEYIAQTLLAASQLKTVLLGTPTEGAFGAQPDVRTVAAMATALIQDVERLAGARGLTLRGRPGEIVQYAPHAHRVAGDVAGGVTRVRMLRPMVERVSPAGATTVVVRALVEPISGS